MRIESVVKDAAGNPIAGAVMLVSPARVPGPMPVRIVAGEDGIATVEIPGNDQYDVLVSAPSGRVLSRWTAGLPYQPTPDHDPDPKTSGLRIDVDDDGYRATISLGGDRKITVDDDGSGAQIAP